MTLDEQIACVERELTMRQKVYPGLVDRRKMSPDTAERELLRMAAVRETLLRCKQLADVLEQAVVNEERGVVEIARGYAMKAAKALRGE